MTGHSRSKNGVASAYALRATADSNPSAACKAGEGGSIAHARGIHVLTAVAQGRRGWPGHSRSKNGVASLAYTRSKNGVASLASHHLPVFFIDDHGSCGGLAAPFCNSSIACLSGERTNAMVPSRGGRLMVTPPFMRRSQVA